MTLIEWTMDQKGNDLGVVHMLVEADEVDARVAAIESLGFPVTVVG